MIEIFTAACGGFLAGWVCRTLAEPAYSRMQDPDWRRSFNHENTNRPSGPPPLKLRRSRDDDRLDSAALQHGQGSWLAPGGRVVDACGRTVGYIPRSQGRTPNPPPSDP